MALTQSPSYTREHFLIHALTFRIYVQDICTFLNFVFEEKNGF